MVATIKFSQFANASLTNTTNMIVGVSSLSGGTNFQAAFPLTWATAGRPTSPAAGVLGYNTSLGQYEFWNGASWIQLAAGGSGSVNVGATNELAYYATTGAAVSGLTINNNAVLLTNGAGVPAWSAGIANSLLATNASGIPAWLTSTASSFLVANASGVIGWSSALPSGLILNQPTLNQPNTVGVINGSSAPAGSVGEIISSLVPFGSAVTLANSTPADITSISLTAGNWLVNGSIHFFNAAERIEVSFGWVSQTSATLPDFSGYNGIETTDSTIGHYAFNTPISILMLTSPQTVYLSAFGFTASGALTACGAITALRFM